MKKLFILVTIIYALSTNSDAEIWKCTREGSQSASYTDTPTGEPGVNCEKVEAMSYTKSDHPSGRVAAPARVTAVRSSGTKKVGSKSASASASASTATSQAAHAISKAKATAKKVSDTPAQVKFREGRKK